MLKPSIYRWLYFIIRMEVIYTLFIHYYYRITIYSFLLNTDLNLELEFANKYLTMKTASQLLVNTTGILLQNHAFDHLPDEKLSLIRKSFFRLTNEKHSLSERKQHETALLNLYAEADLFTETTSPQSMHQWQTVMNCFGRFTDPVIEQNSGIE